MYDWVKVTDRLPEDQQYVLISFNYPAEDGQIKQRVMACYFRKQRNHFVDADGICRSQNSSEPVTHWLECPTPPNL